MIQKGSTVQVHYVGKFEDGSVFDSSEGRAPLQFTIGSNQVIPGFENGLIGLNTGDKITLNIEPKEGYGEIRQDLLIEVNNEQLPGKVEIGQTLQTTNSNQVINLTVKEIYENSVLLDANHPLAGKELVFDIDIVEVA
jgi:FKBP-type peptidyl-prolyl cis-trans isomerase 2